MDKTLKIGILSLLCFWSTETILAQPTTAAPTPTHDATDVVALFSEHYTTNCKPEPQNWGKGATKTTIDGTSDAILAITNTCDAIFTTGWSAQNKGTIHVDIWPATTGTFSFGIGNNFNNEVNWLNEYNWPKLTAGQWNSVEIPVVEFVKVGLNTESNVQGIRFKGSGEYWVDNIYAFGPKEEYVITADIPVAPTPTYPAEGVLSAFSDSYESYLKNGVVGVSYAGTSLCAVRPYESDREQEVLDLGTITSVTGDGGSGVNISTLDLRSYDSIHVDVYYAAAEGMVDPVDFEFGLIENSDDGWKGKRFLWLTEDDFIWPQLPPNKWVSINVPVAPFLNVPEIAAANGGIIMIRFRGLGHFYVDNLYAFMNEIPPISGLATVELQQTLKDNQLTLHAVENIENVNIYNMTGQQVMVNTTNGFSVQVDLTTLPTGSYMVVATLANGQKASMHIIK